MRQYLDTSAKIFFGIYKLFFVWNTFDDFVIQTNKPERDEETKSMNRRTETNNT